jgi:hypothetical protein
MVAQEEHKGTVDARLNDTAVQSAVHINANFATSIVMAKLCGRSASKGVAEYPYA